MPELQHLPADADASTIVAAVEQDGAAILDNVISPEFIAALREETDPYMDNTSNGEDPKKVDVAVQVQVLFHMR